MRDDGLCALKVNKPSFRRPQLVVQGQGKWNEGSFELTLFTEKITEGTKRKITTCSMKMLDH